MFWRIYRFKIRLNNWNGKHFPCFHTVIETRLGEREIEVGTRAGRVSVSTQFRVLSNFHECNITVWEHGGNVFYFFYKITRRKLANQSSHFLRCYFIINFNNRNLIFNPSSTKIFWVRRLGNKVKIYENSSVMTLASFFFKCSLPYRVIFWIVSCESRVLNSWWM